MKNFNVLGTDLFGDPIKPKDQGLVADKFIFPPFSILDAKQGDWQERKRSWKSIGIESEIGRSEDLTYNVEAKSLDYYRVKEGKKDESVEQGTSVFDPVLTELTYQWYCPKKGQIVDPFAGGSVRGIIAGMLDYNYWGCDLRNEQIEANRKQAVDINPNVIPEWVSGDSMNELENAPYADFIFSCPPYGDLEVYSDLENDLSNMEWHTFIAAYKRIILKSVMKLKDNSFACFVVGDFRDKKGFYRNFVSETISGFESAGARLYNEAILATPIASASMRVSKQFESGRKLVKIHQNVLVFCKGDWREATRKINE